MTTRFDFVPSNVAPFQFQPTLDGVVHTCVITWNLFGRRYYLSCYQLDGTRVFSRAMVGSPSGFVIEELDWEAGVAIAKTVDGHGFVPGSTVRLTIDGANPAAYNGIVDALAVDADTLTWSLPTNPGPTVVPGSAFVNIDLAGGYFTSSLVYREPNRQFEVSP